MDQTGRVVVVGSGRLGGAVSSRLAAAGVAVHAVGRGEPVGEADVVWLTVPDAAIAALAGALPVGPVVLHSAGSLGPEVLHPHRGAVLHPLMTFPPPPGARVPCTLEGHPDAVAVARRLADALGWEPVGGVADRVRYHAAACLASGHLAAAYEDAARLFSSATGVELAVARRTLQPLAQASLARVAEVGPGAITGPAARGDRPTVAAHRAALPAALLPTYDAGTARIENLRADPKDPLLAVKSGGYTPIRAGTPEADDA